MVPPDRREFLMTGGLALAAAGMGMLKNPTMTYAEPSQDVQKENEPAPISDSERADRINRAKELMAENGLGAILLTGGTSLSYFTNIGWGRSERVFGCVLPLEGEPAWICPAFEEGRALERIGDNADVRTWEEDESPYKLIAGFLKEHKLRDRPFGIEETVRHFVVDGLAVADKKIVIVSADPVTHGCRGTKTEHEIEIMTYANVMTLDSIREAISQMEEGMSERQVSALVSGEFGKRGYRGWAMVLFGANAAFPHGTSNRLELKEGMIVLIDTGIDTHGYGADISRTTVFGEPSEKQLQVWDKVKEAQTAALEKAGPGVKAGDVDKAARRVIDKSGYGKGYKVFTHRLGHGIGMDGHEWPYLVKNNSLKLEPGMTFSNEPGIYLPGEFGVRLEDIMYITGTGAKLMTPQATSIKEP